MPFRYSELKQITNDFNEKLGGGVFGSVFKGAFPDSNVVAIKKLEGVLQGEKQFRSEVSTIGGEEQFRSEFSTVLTTMRGTIGYLAPEWISGRSITSKADVFSYGMMLYLKLYLAGET